MNLGSFVLGKFATSELRRFASHILYLEVLLCDFARFFFVKRGNAKSLLKIQ